MFLVGRNIPEHIHNLPQTFLKTPFGQMMKPRIEMALRGVTQGTGTAGVPQPAAAPGVTPGAAALPHGTSTDANTGTVRIVSNLQQLETHLSTATQTGKAAVVFFTSATCPPCKMVYPTYDELAEEAGERGVLLKVDLSAALDIGMKYGVRATPTFMTFLRGEKVDEWSGANPGQLRGNVRLLVEMQKQTAMEQGQHPHCRLDVPSLQRVITQFVLYRKVPQLEKVKQKLGTHGDGKIVDSIINFIQARNKATTPADVPVPDTLPSIAEYLRTIPQHLPRENHFAVVDLARLLFLDPRVAGYFAEGEPDHKTLVSLLSLASSGSSAHAPSAPQDSTSTSPDYSPIIPYNLRMVALQLVCNLFTSPLYTSQHIPTNRSLRDACLHLATAVFLDTDPGTDPQSGPIPSTLRVTAASTLYNFAVLNHNARITTKDAGSEPLTEEEQVELTAATIEALSHESDSGETVRGLAFALGLLVYEAEMDGAVMDVCGAMEVEGVLRGKGMLPGVGGVVSEVGELFNVHRTST